jgi:hypothetical protein
VTPADLRRKSVVIRMTPRQAIEAAHALEDAGFGMEKPRLYSAASAIVAGLIDDGWKWKRLGNGGAWSKEA